MCGCHLSSMRVVPCKVAKRHPDVNHWRNQLGSVYLLIRLKYTNTWLPWRHKQLPGSTPPLSPKSILLFSTFELGDLLHGPVFLFLSRDWILYGFHGNGLCLLGLRVALPAFWQVFILIRYRNPIALAIPFSSHAFFETWKTFRPNACRTMRQNY